ncbi:MAG: NADH-quinone oxidoreductase subunit M [Methylococcaceae bacterium]|nr:NADH-quinone oxidoreductase subunit M [Methylococcaceae bacterium]
MGILSLLLWTPVFGVMLLALTPAQNSLTLRVISNGTATLSLLLAISLMSRYDAFNPALQFNEQFILNIELGNAYALGVDGLSLPMILLTSLLTSVALLVSTCITQHLKTYYICILLLEFGLLGVFLAQDWALFYLFWESTLIPLFFLVDRWGGKRRHIASLNFILYSLGGSIFILVSLFALGQYMPEQGGSLMSAVGEAAQTMPEDEQVLVLIGFLIGFGVKMPVFPLHAWLPLAHVEAPTPVNILLSGVMLKMGAYGLLRAVVMLPVAVQALQSMLVSLALFSMLYGGLLAWRQRDLKAMLAYASISHMGVILLGIATLNLTGLTGAMLQMTAQGLISGALFLFVGLLIERTGTRNIQDYSSLSLVMPRFAILTTLTLLAAMGLPGLVGFVAELHTIIGGFERWGGWMVFFSLSILVGAAYTIRTIGLLFMGPTKPNMLALEDIKNQELVAASVLVLAIILLGFFPTTLIDLSVASLAQINSVMTERVL